MSVVVIVLPKLEDAKKIRKILMGHGFPQVFRLRYRFRCSFGDQGT